MILSYSQIQLYKRCPKQYFYAYVEKIPQPLHKSLSFGISIHAALYAFFSAYKNAKEIPLQGRLFEEKVSKPNLAYLLQCLDKAWVSTGYDNSLQMYEKKHYAIALLTEFYEQEVGDPNILFLEKSFVLQAGNHSIKGRFDRVDHLDTDTLEIIDYKTGKLRTSEACKDDLQLMLYANALSQMYPQKNIKLTLHFLEHRSRLPVGFDVASLQRAEETVSSIGNFIEEGIFDAKPETSTCSYCSYSKLCPEAL